MASQVHVRIRRARPADAGELFTLQRAAYVSEAQRRRDPFVAPLDDEVDDVVAVLADPGSTVLVAATTEDGEHGHRGRLVGSIRLTDVGGGTVRVGRVVVAPDLRGRGLGSALLEAVHAEAEHQPGVEVLELPMGTASSGDLALYRRYGYVEAGSPLDARGEDAPVMRRPVR